MAKEKQPEDDDNIIKQEARRLREAAELAAKTAREIKEAREQEAREQEGQ